MAQSKSVSRRHTAAAASVNPGEGIDTWSNALEQMLLGMPDAITILIETLLHAEDEYDAPRSKGKGKAAGKKAKRRRMDEDELFEVASALRQALEELRYDVERNRKDAVARLEQLRQDLLEAGQSPGINPDMFLLVLQQFAAAKLDIGDGLRGLAEQMMTDMAGSAPADDAPSMQEVVKSFKELASNLDGNLFAVHAEIQQFTQALPMEMRAALAASVLAQTDVPELRDAVLGWLLDDTSEVRQIVAQVLEKDARNNSGTTLRRMVALRNWVPEADRPALDRAIKASQKKVACASWPSAKVLETYATGCDGSGAQSVFMIVGQGRKRAFTALLFKQGFGVRDAWADHGCTKAEADARLQAVSMQMDLSPVPVEYAAGAVRHFLGVNAQSGILPPYGLLEVAELAGLSNLNPEFQPVDALVSSLCTGIAPERATPQAIAKALKASASWSETQPMAGTWFEDSDEADAVLAQGRLSKAKRKAALLAMPMQKRRRWWAELIAWSAYMMKHAQGASGWEDYALVARELLGERPLDEFGIMNEIAEATLSNIPGRW